MTDNPKDIVGSKKVPLSVVPAPVLLEVAVGMYEGAVKYGPYNWRESPVRASIYYDATIRHLMAWYEGEDIDPDSGLSHITKAITSLVVLRDAMLQDTYKDDRPISNKDKGWITALNSRVAALAQNRQQGTIPARTAVLGSLGYITPPGHFRTPQPSLRRTFYGISAEIYRRTD